MLCLEALNSLLKFLEEPNQNIYAIFTAQSEFGILPTIKSRCQNIKILSSFNINNLENNDEISQEDIKIFSILGMLQNIMKNDI